MIYLFCFVLEEKIINIVTYDILINEIFYIKKRPLIHILTDRDYLKNAESEHLIGCSAQSRPMKSAYSAIQGFD
jgi:hypothetical protein